MKDSSLPPNFWKRLVSFVSNVQVNDSMSEEEKEMILLIAGEQKDSSPIKGETAEEILKKYETYIKHSYVPIFLEKNVLAAMEEYANQKLEDYRRLSSKEDRGYSEQEAEQFAMEFADYIENERWRYDYAEQKTHSYAEHLEHFKQKYGGVLPSPPKEE